ncbi:hypothetical protein SMKC057_45300 [Serratia marcescens]|nr:hypothetical protein SMKC057_45300 [Serratia marcescens]
MRCNFTFITFFFIDIKFNSQLKVAMKFDLRIGSKNNQCLREYNIHP